MNTIKNNATVKAAMVLFAASILIVGCATPRTPVHDPPHSPHGPTEPVKNDISDQDILPLLKTFQLRLLTENEGFHHGSPFIGLNSRFQLVLLFPRKLPRSVTPDRFNARIGPMEHPFSKQNAHQEFFTRILAVTEQGLEIDPGKISIFYKKGNGQSILLGKQESIAVDATPPSSPSLRLRDRGPDHFTLTWSDASRDVKAYVIQTFEAGQWVKIPPGSVGGPPVRVEREPVGRVRVMAVDRAMNRTPSNEIDLAAREDDLTVADMKILAPISVTDEVNDRIVNGKDSLDIAYAVQVTANRPCRLLLVNVDSMGFGYRLLPTPCATGKDFDDELRPSVPKRYPMNAADDFFYLGLDENTGLEHVYAILYEDDAIAENIWQWVRNEICDYGRSGASPAIPKGTVELPGIHASGGKKKVIGFERKLARLKNEHNGKMAWEKRIFHHD